MYFFIFFQAFAQFFAPATGNTAEASATAKRVGKGQNAISLKVIVEWPIVRGTVNASGVLASASQDGKEMHVKRQTAKILHAQTMVLVCKGSAIVRPDGKEINAI